MERQLIIDNRAEWFLDLILAKSKVSRLPAPTAALRFLYKFVGELYVPLKRRHTPRWGVNSQMLIVLPVRVLVAMFVAGGIAYAAVLALTTVEL
jgi:hypothetical protein